MNGKVSVKDAAELWREKSDELFGIVPDVDSRGILQDVHWAYGEFGYFPAYALGNLYGAQFLAALKKDIQFDSLLRLGDLLPIKEWFDTHIHQYGSVYLPKELVKRVTHEDLTAQYFIDYLTEKYGKLYT